jgi:hypothetical protein
MAKNKRIKKNWSDEDVQILIWTVAKYSDSRGLTDVEKDIVPIARSRCMKIGKPSPRLFLELQHSLACSNGSA